MKLFRAPNHRGCGTTTELESTNQNKFSKIIIRVSVFSLRTQQRKIFGIVVTLKGILFSELENSNEYVMDDRFFNLSIFLHANRVNCEKFSRIRRDIC